MSFHRARLHHHADGGGRCVPDGHALAFEDAVPAFDVEVPLVRLLDKKLRSRGLDKSDLRLAVELADDYLSNPTKLPVDALANMKRWRARAHAILLGPLE